MSDGTGVPNGGGAGNSGVGVNNNGNGSSNNSSATASYVAPAGEPKIPDGSKGFPLGYSCGRGRGGWGSTSRLGGHPPIF